MKLIGERVKNKKYGLGTIVDLTDTMLYIRFDLYPDEVKKFIYPDCFEPVLIADNPELQRAMEEAARATQELASEKHERIDVSALTKKPMSDIAVEKQPANRKTEFSSFRKNRSSKNPMNVAFKCTYCDGGRTENRIGFDGLCSDDNITTNIRNKRDWCNTGPICIRRYRREITRQEFIELASSGATLCHECKIFKNWKVCAGTINHGRRAGTPITLRRTAPNKLAVLTTRLPGSIEEERIIFAVFVIGLSYAGDEIEEGFVLSNKDYRIELTPAEAKKMLFWKYYSNKNTDAVLWGTGLYRYLDDRTAVKILQDIVRVKSETDSAGAKTLLEYYLTVNKITEK